MVFPNCHNFDDLIDTDFFLNVWGECLGTHHIASGVHRLNHLLKAQSQPKMYQSINKTSCLDKGVLNDIMTP